MAGPSIGPIQTIPRGLLGLLNLKNLGRLPDSLNSEVTPVIDLSRWWLTSEALFDVITHGVGLSTSGPLSLNFSSSILVPDNQVWWIERYTVELSLPAAAGESAQNVAPIIFLSQAAPVRSQCLVETPITVTGGTGTATGSMIGCGGFFAPPGSSLGVYVGRSITGTTIAVNGTVYATRMQV
jgi:hypothetical protein